MRRIIVIMTPLVILSEAKDPCGAEEETPPVVVRAS